MNRKDENRFKNQNRECDIDSQVIRLADLVDLEQDNAQFRIQNLTIHIYLITSR